MFLICILVVSPSGVLSGVLGEEQSAPAAAALLVLLEQGLVEKADVKEQVCPVIIRLTEADSLDDYRTEAVAVSVSFLTNLFSP